MPNKTGDIPTHAGGIVFRRSANGSEYLLVRARKPPAAWVFPKGHIESSESPEHAAVREVLEEAGARANIVARLGHLALDGDTVEMFLMTYDSSGAATGERECVWLPYEKALQTLSFDESRQLLRAADRIVKNIS